MTHPKFPSEEQGGFDPIPTHPEPLSPGRNAVDPEEEPGLDEVPDDEAGKPPTRRDRIDLDSD
ncbi:hypothetical protein ACX3YD_13555 [Pseudomonas fluorescens group sp. PF-1]|jgi:hypothetical protein|uniref:hypothetical protein n=1 Tax=Pseudomonas sp. DP16D-R1 TaxID=2075551 RepID=UPI000CD08B87|nr:hypothetical protein [Pseudomonas sp. DP16D-R1]POA75160.1 hypothetical protein C1890_23975 [Pseudomonas sp. DP16D-R1]